MRNLFLLLIFVFGGIHGYSQYVYYGYPTNNVALKKGDIVILNIPIYKDCKFDKIEDFDNLIKLLKLNESNKLRIEINVFYGDSILSNDCSDLLCNNLNEILKLKTTLNNYYIISTGNKNPIFLRKDDIADRRMYIKYVMFNSRLEITIE